MRTKDTLKEFSDIALLLQYLYMDENNTITVNNGLVDIKLRMDEDFKIFCKNMNFPDVPEMNWSENFTPSGCLGVIDKLKETPPAEYNEKFKNRWEEIKTITLHNMALNRI